MHARVGAKNGSDFRQCTFEQQLQRTWQQFWGRLSLSPHLSSSMTDGISVVSLSQVSLALQGGIVYEIRGNVELNDRVKHSAGYGICVQ